MNIKELKKRITVWDVGVKDCTAFVDAQCTLKPDGSWEYEILKMGNDNKGENNE